MFTNIKLKNFKSFKNNNKAIFKNVFVLKVTISLS